MEYRHQMTTNLVFLFAMMSCSFPLVNSYIGKLQSVCRKVNSSISWKLHFYTLFLEHSKIRMNTASVPDFNFCFSWENAFLVCLFLADDYDARSVPLDDQPPPVDLLLNSLIRSSYQFPKPAETSDDPPISESREMFSKRSRSYRPYPYSKKLHYDLDCIPRPTEVIDLLVAMHQSQLGSYGSNIIFCNAWRNPKYIQANPRYIGKRNWNSE